ncbi:hypothetical protein [Amycolatopsis pithecellobii]|uniref:DUF961 domain-containing protein n=1 Tax=Amycolatopsis pithecellobii TaxID=664692 RepID=A0A6N7YLR6_9PSEU|nr:hypothetical protein [Amycolatopsis pithecellobii]MTD53875.1 hypothetical protein [Amycolatopsis pithecellobii]
MQDISINLGNYRLMVTEAPTMKTRENAQTGELETVTNRAGEVQFVVVLFAKPVAQPGRRPGKGEEIRVNLPADPGEGFDEGSYVELINPVLNTYEMRDDNGRITASGLWFKADGLKPAAPRGLSSAA